MIARPVGLGSPGDWKGTRLLTSLSLTDAGYQPLLEIYNGTLYGGSGAISSGWGGYNIVLGPGDLSANPHRFRVQSARSRSMRCRPAASMNASSLMSRTIQLASAARRLTAVYSAGADEISRSPSRVRMWRLPSA